MRKIMNKRTLAVVLSVMVCVLMLVSTGCDQLMQQAMQSYGMGGQPAETLEEGQSIYDLSMFNSLPSGYSKIDPLMWECEGKSGNKVYFLGSIHVADDSAYRIPEKIMDAYLASDALAVECDINAIQTDLMAQLSLSKYMTYTDGSKISDHIDPELYAAMTEFANTNMSSMLSSLGYNSSMLDMMKPSVWTSLFENYYADEAGLDSNLGIDSHFLTIAAAQKKKIIELESAEFQYSMLDSFSDDLFEQQLWGYIQGDVEENIQLYRDMFEGWKVGDPKTMMNEDPDYSDATPEEIAEYEAMMEEYYDKMLYSRNKGMAEKAAAMIDGGQNVFYIVGCGHFVGDRSVIDLLLDAGYPVKQIGGQDASPYLDMLSIPNGGNPNVVGSNTTATTTAQSTAVTNAGGHNYPDYLYGKYDYDLYAEMYEYYGGTTAKTEKTQKTEKTEKTEKTKKTTASNGGWGGWGYSD